MSYTYKDIRDNILFFDDELLQKELKDIIKDPEELKNAISEINEIEEYMYEYGRSPLTIWYREHRTNENSLLREIKRVFIDYAYSEFD